MSPCTSRLSFFIAVAMPRCGQPVQSTGGRGMTEPSSAAFSSAQRGRSRPASEKPRPTRTAVSSPHCGNHCLPSQAMPAARICSSRYGSSSSTTNSRSTVRANARMASTGSGWIMPSLRKAAPGSASLALRYAAPAETTPIFAEPPPCSGTGPAAGTTCARSPEAALASANTPQPLDALEEAAVQRPRELGQQAVLLGLAVRGPALGRRPGHAARVVHVRRDLAVEADDALLVRRLDAQAHHHRHVELLAHREGALGVLVALLAVRRLEHRHAADAAEVAVVLLGHAAGHAGVAGEAHDEPPVDAGVDRADQRIGRDTAARALHRRQGADAAHRGPERHLVGDLLVGGPFRVHAVVAGQVGDDLRAGRTGICRGDLHAGLPGPAGDSFVAEHQVGVHQVPPPMWSSRPTIRRGGMSVQVAGRRVSGHGWEDDAASLSDAWKRERRGRGCPGLRQRRSDLLRRHQQLAERRAERPASSEPTSSQSASPNPTTLITRWLPT